MSYNYDLVYHLAQEIVSTGKERLGEILNVQPSYAKDLTNSFLGEYLISDIIYD